MIKLISLLFSLMFFLPSFSMPSSPSEDGPVVIRIKNGGIDDGGPRVPALVPIQGIIVDSRIYLYFSSDLGDVDVTLEEATCGSIMHTVVDASSPYATIPFSGDAGDYTITFTLENGAEYVGSFLL